MSAIGVFAALDSASATSGRDKAKNVASQLAESDQERLRSMTIGTINNLRDSRTESSDGDVYTIDSRADWVNDTSGTASCSGSNTSFDYMKIRSTVSWAGMGSAKPVVADSLRAVPNGSFGSTQGSIAIEILDRNGAGVPGVSVSITGAKNFTETTNSNGCIFIGFVPAGTYGVAFSKSGYVESKLPNRTSISDSMVVAGEQTSTQSYLYDAAGTASVRFRTTTTVCTSPCTLANANGDSLTLGHASLGLPSIKTFTFAAANVPNPLPTGLFPFTSAYAVWGGACSQANPTNYTQPANGALTVPAGGTSSQIDVRLPRLQVPISNAAATGGRVIVKPTVPGCTAQASYAANTAAASGTLVFNLPYGTYSVCAQDKTASPTMYKMSTPNPATNTAAGGTAVATINLSSGTTAGGCP
jgi:hypothetical protein